MKLTWDIDKINNLSKNSISAVNLALTKIWLIVQNRAKENAPYLTGTLRKSITTDFNSINKWMVIVWSRVKYAKKREFENRLHPSTKYYLMRWYTENKDQIMRIVKTYLSDTLK